MNRNVVLVLVIGGVAALCCGGSGLALFVLGAASEDGARSSGAAGPLVGEWMFGSVSLVEYRSALTGEFAPPSGQGQHYELRADGTCVQSAMLQVSTGFACTSFVFTSTDADACTWSADATTLTIELGDGIMRSRICSGEVKEGASKPRTVKAPYRLERDGNVTWLVLTEESGEFRYRRVE